MTRGAGSSADESAKAIRPYLRSILAPHCVTPAREIATRMTNPADSVAAAADLVENFARSRRVG